MRRRLHRDEQTYRKTPTIAHNVRDNQACCLSFLHSGNFADMGLTLVHFRGAVIKKPYSKYVKNNVQEIRLLYKSNTCRVSGRCYQNLQPRTDGKKGKRRRDLWHFIWRHLLSCLIQGNMFIGINGAPRC